MCLVMLAGVLWILCNFSRSDYENMGMQTVFVDHSTLCEKANHRIH